MAIRVPLEISAPDGRRLVAVAVLNAGFEVPDPRLHFASDSSGTVSLVPHAGQEIVEPARSGATE